MEMGSWKIVRFRGGKIKIMAKYYKTWEWETGRFLS